MPAKLARRRPSAPMIVAAVALFVALGGTAEALHGHNTVRSDDIVNHSILGHDLKDKQIKAQQLHDGAVTTSKSSFISSNSVATASATTAASPTDLGGPSVTVTVPSGGVVEVYAQADISDTGGGQNAIGKVDLLEPTLVATPEEILGSSTNAFQRKYTTPGSNDFDGAVNVTRSGWVTIVPPGPGTYTFSLRYEADGGGTATFQNRTLLVRVTR
jgi:hypothetical protein